MTKRSHKTSKPASDQAVSFVLTAKSYFHHGTYDGAARERDFLMAQGGDPLKILRVLNVSAAVLALAEPAIRAAIQDAQDKLKTTPNPETKS